MGPIREEHVTCLRAVASQQATVQTDKGGRVLFTIDDQPLTGEMHMAMFELRHTGLVYGRAVAVPELLWLTEAGERALESSKHLEGTR